MGTITGDLYDHEGYAAQLLDDGTLTGSETQPRKVGQVVAACGCGWHGATRYPSRDPFDEEAEALALAEWEAEHARPLLVHVVPATVGYTLHPFGSIREFVVFV